MNGKLDEYLQNIEDFVEIEDKIVTYKWVCKALKVHTNTAKQLLYAFSKLPKFDDKLLVTYLVAGEKQNGDGTVYRLINQKDLDEAKKKFKSISSAHVFSVQKGDSVCGADLYNAENTYKLAPEDHRFNSIQPNDDIKRREVNRASSAPIKPDPPSKVSSDVAPQARTATKSNETTKTSVNSTNGKGSNDDASKKPASKISPTKHQKTPSSKDIRGHFKQGAKKKEEPAPEKPPEAPEPMETNDEIPTKTPKSQINDKPKSQTKKKRKKPRGSVESAPKKMKRIKVASNSDSSDNEESDADERYPSPEPEPEPTAPEHVDESEGEEEIIPSTPLEKGRKRVRKLVTRTYTDEEGYIHTEKKYVMDSCSDDENQEPSAKKEDRVADTLGKSPENRSKSSECPPASKDEKQSTKSGPKLNKKVVKPAKTKSGPSSSQLSITSFFTKKPETFK